MDAYSNPHAIHNANTRAFGSIGDAVDDFGNKQIINNVAAASASGGKRRRTRTRTRKRNHTKKMKSRKRHRGGSCSSCNATRMFGGSSRRKKYCRCGCHSGKMCRIHNCQCICHKFQRGGTTSPTQASAPYSIPGSSLKASELGLANPPPIYSSNPFLKF